ncbi:uroporphyrinogen-III synthase [Flavisphingomonas formosensis]|uniref:uroporphyrinogen-III synthase n=1 Tax=Flavisphingomonas formosensis TaxID=861534 RepID=UPI001E6028C6|nr:uroporphyrinogen-III synthase [Sphingomonas formosensis]
MTRAVLILRPEPGAGATAERARALRLEPIVQPLFRIRRLPWDPPRAEGFDAVMMTSANAVRHGGPGLTRYHHLPLHAVGAATAAAARAAGFHTVIEHRGDAAALVAALPGDVRRLLHLAGREHREAARASVSIERRIVYASDRDAAAAAAIVEALGGHPIVLLHSPRAARMLAELVDRAGVCRGGLRLAAISPAALAASGEGWERAAAAAVPTDDALLAVAARLCD